MDKSMIAALVDGLFVFIGFIISKYLPPEWAEALRVFLVALQPIVLVLLYKWLNIELLIKAGLLK